MYDIHEIHLGRKVYHLFIMNSIFNILRLNVQLIIQYIHILNNIHQEFYELKLNKIMINCI